MDESYLGIEEGALLCKMNYSKHVILLLVYLICLCQLYMHVARVGIVEDT